MRAYFDDKNKESRIDVARVLIENGADVNEIEYEERTAMHFAAHVGDLNMAKLLIQNGADVNAVTRDKWTALHYAAHKGHVDVVKLLIQNGADVNAVDKGKRMALSYAATKCNRQVHVRCVLELLCSGAKIDESAIDFDETGLLFLIQNGLKSLRDGKCEVTDLMSPEEGRFMWNLAFVLATKYRVVAFKAFFIIRSFISYNGMFMGPGYDIGTWCSSVVFEQCSSAKRENLSFKTSLIRLLSPCHFPNTGTVRLDKSSCNFHEWTFMNFQ